MKDYGYGNSNGCRRWVKKMWEDPWFGQLINRRYQELVDEGLEEYLYDKLDSLTTLIDASQQLNFELWGIRTRALRERVLYSTYGEYVDYVRSYIKNHMQYLTRAFAAEIGIEIEEPPVVIVPDFKADSLSYYSISNRGTGTCFDIDSEADELCCRQRDNDSESQQWHITTLGNGFLFIENRATGQALTDPSPEGSSATTNVGGNLMLALPDSTDLRQQWNFVAQADGYYNIISRWSGHAANLNSGNAADGTRVISYTSNERDKLSSNRLWLPVVVGTMDTGIETPTMDYALAYDDATGRLHFGAEDLQQLTFTVGVYNMKGHRVGTFRACDDFNLLPYPAGLYIVTWNENGRKHSVKLKI